MRYQRVQIDAIGYELAPVVAASSELERRLESVYRALRLPAGQLEALTGIVERRWWLPGYRISEGALAAGRRALDQAGIEPGRLGALVYAGVCREQFEPATACRVAAELGVGPDAAVYDLSNACLGVLNGIIEIANRIELGQIRAGMVVACETAREINEIVIEQLKREPSMELYKRSLATFTGGSGAAAVVLSDGFAGTAGHRLWGGVVRTRPEFHELCRWGVEPASPNPSPEPYYRQFTSTDAAAVLAHGVPLGLETWQAFTRELGWPPESVAKVVCHQVGRTHKEAILKALEIPPERDFSTYPYLGNLGAAALPLTAALAAERGFLRPGDRTAFLGIGSGLNCLMLGLEW